MLKPTVFIALAVVVIGSTYAEPDAPTKTIIHHYPMTTVEHHGEPEHVQHQRGQQHHGQQHGQTKIRQSGPSKIFGWLGSRFAKIPHYLPRLPQFPKYVGSPKPSQYHAIILPDPPKSAGHSKVKRPEKVKITHVEHTEPSEHESQVSSYHDIASIPEIYENSYTPVPISGDAYSVPESVPQIEVVPSTLLYSNKQIIQPPQSVDYKPLAPAPIAAPPLQYTYSSSQTSYNTIPAPARKPSGFHSFVQKQPSTVPIVPQSTGPDYFDTAYRSPNEQQFFYKATAPAPTPVKQTEVQQSIGFSVNDYAVHGSQNQQQGIPQMYDSSVNLAAIGGPVISSSAQQAAYDALTAQSSYAQVQKYANQVLNNQAHGSLTANSVSGGQETSLYGQYSQLSGSVVPAPVPDAANPVAAASVQQQQYAYQPQQPQQSQSSGSGKFEKTDIPGVQILSQGTDSGNPVFEVLADANAPDYNGHPFDISKLISMIEPGAQLESAELSHAASETKTTYVAPASPSAAETSGINDLILSESDPSLSVTQVNGSNVPSLPSYLNVNSKTNKNSSSSLKEIMDFFQQTGGKGYILVEKKRHRSDNLTLDFDQNLDDDLTNGPTRVNITSKTILPQLELLEHDHDHHKPSTDNSNENSNNSDTDTDTDTTNTIPTDLLFPLDSPKYADYEVEDNEDYDHDHDHDRDRDDIGNNDKLKSSFSYNSISSNSNTDKRQKTDQTTATSITTVAESRLSNNSTTTVRPPVVPVTQASKLTTLFEPVTPGKPAIFATTPSSIENGSTLHPNHNYFAIPPSNFSTQIPVYSSLGSLPGSEPTVNSFLDAIDESLLDDDPIETEGDLNASESQQVRSIAITVTPPPKLTYSSTESVSKISKGIPLTTTGSPSASGTTTSTEGPLPPVTVPLSFLIPATNKTGLNSSKSRPAPVYRGRKSNNST